MTLLCQSRLGEVGNDITTPEPARIRRGCLRIDITVPEPASRG